MSNTSQFSAVNIGITNSGARHAGAREHFKTEAAEVQSYLKNVHHTRKDAFMQVRYGSTVDLLGKAQMERSLSSSQGLQSMSSLLSTSNNSSSSANMNSSHQLKGTSTPSQQKYSDFMRTMSKNTLDEQSRNDRRRRYNFEMGRKAEVNQIISGKAKEGKVYLFPHKATHTQVLALTGKLAMPNVNVEPPDVPRTRKWLGESIGWEQT